MRDLDLYKELCKIDMYNNHIDTKYPYSLREDITFTQHELTLHYKKNYCNDIVVLTESNQIKGSMDHTTTYSFVVYEDT